MKQKIVIAGIKGILALGFLYLSSCVNESKPPKLLRKPYLQTVLADSATVLWRTENGTKASVAFKKVSDSLWAEAEGVTRKTRLGAIENEVSLHNLDPYTRYEYRIFTDGQALLAEQSYEFRSAANAQQHKFNFFAVGDIGEPLETGGTPDQLANALERERTNFDLGVLLGDIIYPDGKSEVYDQNLFQYFGEVFPYVPLFTVLGNHDWHAPEKNYIQEWKLPHNEYYYSFDYSKVHFTALDSKNGDFYEYDKQVEWLKNDLREHKEAEWNIIIIHHNGNSCTYKEDYERVVKLYPIFEQYGVDLVLNGHAHTYERLNPMNGEGKPIADYIGKDSVYRHPEGFISITVGSGGKLRGVGSDPKPFTPDPENCRHPNLVAKAAHLWAYLHISIDGNVLTGKTIATEDFSVVDEFRIEK